MIVPYSEAWSEPVRELLRTCLGPDAMQLDEALWRWQYERNPAVGDGPAPLHVFGDEPEALGVLGRIPVRLSTGSGEVDAAWGIDVMVHPEFQNAGIGGLLIEAWDASTPVSLSLGVTDMAFEVFLASGRTHVGDVPVYKRFLSWDRVVEPRLGQGLAALLAEKAMGAWGARALDRAVQSAGLEWQRMESFGEECDQLWERAAQGLGFAVRRDAAALAWRFAQYPRDVFDVHAVRRDGTLLAWFVTCLAPRGDRMIGYLCDCLWTDDPAALRFGLAHATYELEARAADMVECLASHPAVGRTLRHLGYWPRPTKTRLLFKVNRPDLASTFAGAGELERWHVTFADSDALTVMLEEG